MKVCDSLVIALFVVSMDVCWTLCVGGISILEYGALEALFNSTNGMHWSWNQSVPNSTHWQFPSSLSAPCSLQWQGVNCSSNTASGGCAVSALELSDYKLNGTLPSEIGQLTALQSLCLNNSKIIPEESDSLYSALDQGNPYLSSVSSCDFNSLLAGLQYVNRIRGSIPTQIGALVSLTRIDMSNNILSGQLPTEIGQLLSLEHLDISSNKLTGSLPTQIGELSSLVHVDISNNRLSGFIPTEFGQLVALSRIDISSNRLNGSLPLAIFQLVALTELHINSNRISGSIPTNIGQLLALRVFYANKNRIAGSLPTEIGMLTAVTELFLDYNHLTGIIPSEIGGMVSLTKLYLYHNSLSGSVPTTIGLLTYLSTLNILANQLSGKVPTEIGLLTVLKELVMSKNSLYGPIPTQLATMSALRVLILNTNCMTGSIPSEIGLLSPLSQIWLNGNNFEGSIPTEIGRLFNLTQLYLYNNKLSGRLPSELGMLTGLTEISVMDNRITGHLPTELGSMGSLLEFYVNRNSLSGTLPTEMGLLASLQMLVVSDNSLSGTLPTEMGMMAQLFVGKLFSNCLTGSIPSEVGQLPIIASLMFHQNYFSGEISAGLFSISSLQLLDVSLNVFSKQLPQLFFNQSALESIDVSMNLLSGSLPRIGDQMRIFNSSFNLLSGDLNEFFSSNNGAFNLVYLDVSHNLLTGALPSLWSTRDFQDLATLMLNSNCFSGSISSSFTRIPQLQNLILDAFGSAEGCDVQAPHWLRWMVKGLFLKHAATFGTLPPEIVQIETLNTLHAAGNTLTGTLPELRPESMLIDVSLANNYLQGTIPISWQKHGRFEQLDLSCNKLAGILWSNLSVPLLNQDTRSSANAAAKFDLSVNRLSGNIPSSLYTALGVNILDGNLFQCQQSHMPEHDVNRNTYTCGSENLNSSLISWLVICFCVIGTFLFLRFKKSSIIEYGMILDDQKDSNVKLFLTSVEQISHVSVKLAGSSVIVLLLAYVVMKSDFSLGYSTHTYQYGWVTTVSYLNGAVPTFFTLCFVFIAVMLSSIRLKQVSTNNQMSLIPENWRYSMLFKVCSILICHIIVTVAVNVIYVFTVLEGLPASRLTAIQFALGGFKLAWNTLYVDWSLARLPFLNASSRLHLTSVMKIFTFLISPYVATFSSDSTCFSYVILGTPVVRTTFLTSSYGCDQYCFNSICEFKCGFIPNTVIATSTSPPWLYSYQCSSALLTNYVPVLVASFLVSGLIIPVGVTIYGLIPAKWIDAWIPVIVRDFLLKGTIYIYKLEDCKPAETETGDNSPHSVGSITTPVVSTSAPLFLSHQVMSKLVMNLAVILTFGFAAPLLAVIVAVDSYSNTIMWKYLIQRYLNLHLIASQSSIAHAKTQLETATADSCAGLYSSWQVSILSVAFFWGLFVFDMMGDVYGPRTGGLSVLAPTLSLLCVWLFSAFLSKLFAMRPVAIKTQMSYGIELEGVCHQIAVKTQLSCRIEAETISTLLANHAAAAAATISDSTATDVVEEQLSSII